MRLEESPVTGITEIADAGIALGDEDRAILDLECETVVGHTCKVIRLAPRGLDADSVRTIIAGRIHEAPLLTRRLGGTPDAPAWVIDPDFDLARHVVPAATAAPLDDAGLRAHVGVLFARHLDRDRPLWQLDVAPLADGGSALIWRLHHALADGTTVMRLARALLWDSWEDKPASPMPSHAGDAEDAARRCWHLAGFCRRELSRSHHASPFDGEIGTAREIGMAAVSVGQVKRAAHAVGGATVNDALLSVVAGAVRRYLETHHGSLADIRARVPVSLHHEGDTSPNRDSFFSVRLPLHIADPVERLHVVHTATLLRKRAHDAQIEDALLHEFPDVVPVRRFVERLNASPRRFAVSVSNVPGPRREVSIAGVAVTDLVGIAEIGMRHALRIAAVSLHDRLSLGFCADPTLVPGVQTMADAAEAEAAALVAATSAT
jgi:diacylglycerol O-acyltransferase / wax synthase